MNCLAEPLFIFTESEERVHKLVYSLQTGIILQGPDKEILFYNQAALVMLGLSEDELYGRVSFHADWKAVHEDGSHFTEVEHPVATCIRTRESVTNIVMGVNRPKNADRVWLLMNAVPLLTTAGKVKEVICSFNDITPRVLAEEKLQSLYQSLEHRAFELATINTELKRFVYVATHDLQEPLRLINSFTDLLKRNYSSQLDEKAQLYIEYAVEGATRMKKLIQALSEFSKFSTEREECELIDMNELVGKVKAKFSDAIQQAGATITSVELPVILGYAKLINQLIENLLENAIQYKSDQPLHVFIDYKVIDEKYLFSIKDNGIGIDPAYTEKIFILFHRMGNNDNREEGLGAGLAICRKIVELHHGHISVDSAPGQGSTFYFSIHSKQYQSYEKL